MLSWISITLRAAVLVVALIGFPLMALTGWQPAGLVDELLREVPRVSWSREAVTTQEARAGRNESPLPYPEGVKPAARGKQALVNRVELPTPSPAAVAPVMPVGRDHRWNPGDHSSGSTVSAGATQVGVLWRRLQSLGVRDLDLMQWGSRTRFYRACARVPRAEGSSFLRHFEATAASPEQALHDLTTEIVRSRVASESVR